MNSFWIDPPPPLDAKRRALLWEVAVASAQPLARSVVRPFRFARIIVAGHDDVAIVPAVWGLVPSWATPAERRQVAARHTILDGDMVPESNVTSAIWKETKLSRRCLVPVSGWVASTGIAINAYCPEERSVTLAGLQCDVVTPGKPPVTTFGVFTRCVSIGPFDGSQVPIIVRAEDRARWLSCSPNDARRMLRPPPFRVSARLVKRLPLGSEFSDA